MEIRGGFFKIKQETQTKDVETRRGEQAEQDATVHLQRSFTNFHIQVVTQSGTDLPKKTLSNVGVRSNV